MSKHETHTASRRKNVSSREQVEDSAVPANGDIEPDAAASGASEQEGEADEVRNEISDQMRERNDAADIALAAVDELADRAAEYDELKQQLDAAQEQLLRNAAEFQNYRRRTEQEKSQLVELGKSVVLRNLLNVVDDFQRSLEAAEHAAQQEQATGPAFQALKDGVEMVYRKLMDELSRLGVEPIESVGHPFDENEHEAMMQQPNADAQPGTVVEEIQKGYRMGDRILRHAKVIVAA